LITIVKSKTKCVEIAAGCPITIIGENINPTRRKALINALTDRQYEVVIRLAQAQLDSGADLLDLNVGVPGIDEAGVVAEVVDVLTEHFDVPLCLDSTNPQALAAGLKAAPGRPLVNSVTGEEASLAAILPIVRDFQVPVVALTIDDDGIPGDPDRRVAIAGKILERASRLGIPSRDIVIDPLVLAASADMKSTGVTLRAMEMIRREFGVNIIVGASNVSFGLPARQTVNQAFIALAAQAGLTCALTNPQKMGLAIRAVDLLLGHDAYGLGYLKHYRATNQEAPRKLRRADKGPN
jgi:5-methyltetrahydrofolate--homocysteine methyltransferase